MILSSSVTNRIKEHSINEAPNECCGLILKRSGQIEPFKCENISLKKRTNFSISPKDYLAASKLGRILAYYHSHTDENENFSDMDKFFSRLNNLPLVLCCLNNDTFSIYD